MFFRRAVMPGILAVGSILHPSEMMAVLGEVSQPKVNVGWCHCEPHGAFPHDHQSQRPAGTQLPAVIWASGCVPDMSR